MSELETGVPAESFYARALEIFRSTQVPFLVGGAYAMREYAGIFRDTKDLDVFCKPGDYPKLLRALTDAGYRTEITDATWIAKAFDGDYFIDLIFGSANGVSQVDDTWFGGSHPATVVGCEVNLVPAEEQLWQKALVQERHRYDGADVNHIFLKWGDRLDWKRLLDRMESQWEILFAHVLQFRFVYPADRNKVPNWLMEELLSRVTTQLKLPVPSELVCRGPLLSKLSYAIDIQEWGYKER